METVGNNTAVSNTDDLIQQAAATNVSVLIYGGTHTEDIARRIHTSSPRNNEPFTIIDCATMSPELLAFGSNKTGTIFLDEIAQMPLVVQHKLLRLIQQKINVRLIASSRENLIARINAGQFLHDLYAHLNALHIEISPPASPMLDLGPTSIDNSVFRLDEVIMVKADLSNSNFDLKRHLESIEVNLIQQALQKSRGVVAMAARILGIRRTTLIEKMKKYQIVKDAIARA